MDWKQLGDETVDLLRRYVTIDTTNPPGNEAAGVKFLADVLDGEGLAYETLESAPGRSNLCARVRGDGSQGAVVLHHHIDVVYADPRQWTVDPFGGCVRDGYLYGRGTLDMKSTGIVQLVALLALKRARVPLRRDLIFLATADEEAGSLFGLRYVVEHRPQWLAGAEYALSETGGTYTSPRMRAPFALIDISEKAPMPFRLTARNRAGHASMPWAETAPNKLVRALGRLMEAERPLRVLPAVQEYFAAFARILPSSEEGLSNLRESLTDPAFRARFLAKPHWASSVRTTLALTMLQGSEKRNVIPAEATAEVDCRVLAGDDGDEILEWARRVIADDDVEIVPFCPAVSPRVSSTETAMYRVLADTLRRRAPEAVVAPRIMAGASDNETFRSLGMHSYGFTPFVLDNGDERRIHGTDERISAENLRAGVQAYGEMLLAIAAA